jgi:hypothetical protein
MTFNEDRYKIYTWKHWMLLHWILNPGLAINELLLGQRVPKITLEDKTSDKPRIERTFVPCPHCESLHDGRTWSTENGTAFKNWFGLYCPSCGEIIPCLVNATSMIIMVVTFPVWGLFRNMLKDYWLKKQPARYANIDINKTTNHFSDARWVKSGLGFGLIMFLGLDIAAPYLVGQADTITNLLPKAVIWTVAGLGFGYFMMKYLGTKGVNH